MNRTNDTFGSFEREKSFKIDQLPNMRKKVMQSSSKSIDSAVNIDSGFDMYDNQLNQTLTDEDFNSS